MPHASTRIKTWIITARLLFLASILYAEDGYRLWLRYDKINDPALLARYKQTIQSITVKGSSVTLDIIRKEVSNGISGLLGTNIPITNKAEASVWIGKVSDLAANPAAYSKLGKEGYMIHTQTINGKKSVILCANTDIGLLYGAFHFLRLLQTHQPLENLLIESVPKLKLRMLNHWDNLNRTVERGYAGFSIWNWHTLPGYIDQRYIDYARANASVGINAVSLTNVNANATILTKPWLEKVKALADVFRPYGIKVFLTARFSAPIEIGKLKTADPVNDTVQTWWNEKAKEIYSLIPDFGGFLVKANSEGQPGPQDYKRTHADGANMLADALSPFGGLVIWRAFVYDARPQRRNENYDSAKVDAAAQPIASADRFKQAYNEFNPLDGKFRNNVMIQVKNGPIDFQPREPFSPLFGSMEQTPVMMEFQLTKEYLGQGTHLVYEAPLFKEVLEADTYSKGKGSTVAKVIDGSMNNNPNTGMAGVSNIGNDRNWTSHPFNQADWYAFGRLAWDHTLAASQIADEWIRQSFTNDINAVAAIKQIMLASREAVVNYMTPLGLHHIMATGHHYGPGPWVDNLARADWNPVYFHRADAAGLGFNRTGSGSDALAQYKPEVQAKYKDINQCPDEYLLWFHHAAWDHKMHSGRTLWNELCYKYQAGVDSVRRMQQQWNSLKNIIDEERFQQVTMFLAIQENDAVWWRNACLLYFQTFSKMPFPSGYEQPDKTLEYYKSLRFPFAPGN